MQLFEYIDILNTPYDLHLETVTDSDFFIKPHWHYYTEILYLTEGGITVTCKEQDYLLHAGDLLFIAAQSIHSIHTAQPSTKYVVIKFDLNTLQIPRVYISGFRTLFTDSMSGGAYLFSKERLVDYSVATLCQNGLMELETKDFAYDFNVRSNLSMLLVALARILLTEQPVAPGSARKKTDNLFFFGIPEYIDAHSGENLRVQQLADKCGMSYSNFAKTFKETYGRSCKEYIEYIRINKAEEMVLHSDYPISYIAQENGFADCSHFIRTYKKFRNKTPKQTKMEHLARLQQKHTCKNRQEMVLS